jgi:hypothetical protein
VAVPHGRDEIFESFRYTPQELLGRLRDEAERIRTESPEAIPRLAEWVAGRQFLSTLLGSEDEARRVIARAAAEIGIESPPSEAHSPDMDMSREEVDAKIEASEARTDTKFAQLMGEMKAGFARMDERMGAIERSTAGIKATVIVTGIAIVGLVVAVMAYGSDRIGLGASISDIAANAARQTVRDMAPPKPTP